MPDPILTRDFNLARNAQKFMVINQIIFKPNFPHQQISNANLKIHDYPINDRQKSTDYLNGHNPPDRGTLKTD